MPNDTTQPDHPPTLEPFLVWLRENDRSPRTVRAYSVAVRDFATWFRHRTNKELAPEIITPLDVKEYRSYLTDERRLKATTINNYLAGLRAYARWAKHTGRAEHNPANGIKSIRVAKQAPRWLSREDQYRLLRAAKEQVQLGDLRAQGDPGHPGAIWPRRNRAVIVLLLNTGLRLAEAAALRLDDVEINDRSGSVRVRAGKGQAARQVPLNNDARTALREWMEVRQEIESETENDRLFLSQKKGGPLSARAISFCVKSLAEKAGLEDVSPHTLRHSFGKNLTDAGVGLEKVATLLGHENLETTRLYTTPSEADLQEATERIAWGEQ